MFFSLLTFASAFLIEGLGTWISIIGLSSLFRTDPIIIALAAALDVGKVVTVSFLYKEWHTAPRTLRFYMILATAVLMAITSAGAFGYLSAAFQGAIQDTKQQEILIAAAKEEKAKLEARKREIDAQIANLPANIVRGRQRLIVAFKAEADRVNARIAALDAEVPRMQVQQVTLQHHAGPIVYVSQAFDVSVERAVKYVILVIIFVFDPLAIALLVAGNFLWEKRKKAVQAAAQASAPPPVSIERTQETLGDDAAARERAQPEAPADAVSAPGSGEKADAGRCPLPAEAEPAPAQPETKQASETPGDQTPQPGREPAAGAGTAEVKTAEAGGRAAARTAQPEQAVREAAYYLAENRRFKDGTPMDDWIQAEEDLTKGRRSAG